MAKDNLLDSGDRIEIAVTHEILIGREKAWIKYAVQGTVRQEETPEAASLRLTEAVNSQIMRTIEEAVRTVEQYEEQHK